MIVNDLDINWALCSPAKADPVLVIDPNAVLTGPIPTKCLEPITRRRTQEFQRVCGIKLRQLAGRHTAHGGKSLALSGLE
jgi:hypothetical protein